MSHWQSFVIGRDFDPPQIKAFLERANVDFSARTMAARVIGLEANHARKSMDRQRLILGVPGKGGGDESFG